MPSPYRFSISRHSFRFLILLFLLWFAVLYYLKMNRVLSYDITVKVPADSPFGLRGAKTAQTPQCPERPQLFVASYPDVVRPTVPKELFPEYSDVPRPDGRQRWEGLNNKALSRMLSCMMNGECVENQDKIVILSSFHFVGGVEGWVGGEDVWARSIMAALDSLGYTYLFADGIDHLLRLYQMFPSVVMAVFMEEGDLNECWDADTYCIKTPHNPLGIPIWKIFAFSFWPGVKSPLGARWTLSPEPYSLDGHEETFYTGYSVESTCAQVPVIPHIYRKSRVYIMTKRLENLANPQGRAWPPEYFAAAGRETGVTFVLGAANSTDVGDPKAFVPANTENLGILQQNRFMEELSRSVLLVGVGSPSTSPTPYEALCLGVPFLNPVASWDPEDPSNRAHWDAQHGILKYLDPPYVYNVFKDDEEAFVDAVRAAVENPIDGFIMDDMRIESITDRMREVLELDHYGIAKELLDKRMAGRETGPWFTL
ncbi:hypothetical protein OF83DRAFT_21938 [Amylostereum chailletii]|nr:hypothetical protein OF83DRAFT_21938 [Amylostereum chailletii]